MVARVPPQISKLPPGLRVPPSRRLLLLRHHSPSTARSAFVAPLFSYSYELLFSQPLCFDNDLNCPGGDPSSVPFKASRPLSQSPRRRKSRRMILLRTLCRSQKSQVLCNQANPHSLRKIPGVRGISAWLFTSHRSRVTSHVFLGTLVLPGRPSEAAN